MTTGCPATRGDVLSCSYAAPLDGPQGRINEALVETTGPVDGGTGSAPVSFGDARIAVVDGCVAVEDSRVGSLGTVCAESAPHSFDYLLDIVFPECGEYLFDNVATLTTSDRGLTDSASAVVAVSVPCVAGCTLTPGYWKTHSSFGPAPYDATWAVLEQGEDTPFFLSGQSWYQVIWTRPAGNPYYILTHAYIATALNFANGEDPSAVRAAFDEATSLLESWTPQQVAAWKKSNPLAGRFVELAGLLDAYNNGLIGPGHCDE